MSGLSWIEYLLFCSEHFRPTHQFLEKDSRSVVLFMLREKKDNLSFEKLNYPCFGAETSDLADFRSGDGEVSGSSVIPIKALPKVGCLLAKQ